ncbi:MAG: DUF1800 family protein [Parvularculaceae bacterium]
MTPNGQVQLDGLGDPIETYDNDDVTNPASFTGLSWAERSHFGEPDNVRSEYLPLVMFESEHLTESKSFLGTTIPANTPGDQSISLALDALSQSPEHAAFRVAPAYSATCNEQSVACLYRARC